MLNTIYYDYFANEYCLPEDRENTAPPERYLKTIRNSEEYYIERWMNNYCRQIIVKYSDPRQVNDERFKIANPNDFQYMIEWEIPASKFDEYVKRFGLKRR